MAVPASGNQLSLNSIYNELDDNNYNGGTTNADVSLTNLSTGGNPPNESLNTSNDAANRPDGSAPHAMSEFYSYDHDIIAIATPVNINVSDTRTETVAGITFDVNNVTQRIYAFLVNDGILGNGTTYADAQIFVPPSVGAGLTNGYVDTSAGASTYSIFFGLGDSDDFTVVGTNYNVGAANDFVTLNLKGSNDGSYFTSASPNITIGFLPATPTNLSSDRVQNNQFTASWDDPHGTNPAGKYLLWFGDSTTRTSNQEYEINGAGSAGGSVEWYSMDEETLDANSNYYWWIASSGSYGNGVSDYSSRQDVTTKNVTFPGTISNETLSQVANGSVVYSATRNFNITNIPTSGHTGNFSIDITSIQNGTGLLSIAYSLSGDPGTAGNDNFGSGWQNENSIYKEVDIVGSAIDPDNDGTQTIYYKFKFFPATTAQSLDNRTVTFAYNGASEAITVGVTSTKSDRRLKTNINLVGHSKHLQIPIYTFNYKEDLNTINKGVMAQDLLKMNFNHAVITDPDGYYGVLYDLIDVDMETLN